MFFDERDDSHDADRIVDLRIDETVIEVKRTGAAREGIVDVLSMRALARAFAAVVSPPRDSFDRALTRTLNVTGSIAADIQRKRG